MIILSFLVGLAVFTHGWFQLAACLAVGWFLAADSQKIRDAAYQRRVAAARAASAMPEPPRVRLTDDEYSDLDPYGDLA